MALVMGVCVSCPVFAASTGPNTAQGAGPSSVGASGAMAGAGFVSAFAAHEVGHLLANVLLGNRPSLVGIRAFGFVPFFSIDPRLKCARHRDECHEGNGAYFGGGRAGAYAVFTAGFSVQHLTNELIFSRYPNLILEDAPFAKGMLLFNIATSVGYASAAWLRVEDSHGDLGNAARVSGIPRDVLAAFLFVPALLDGVRYFKPGWTALPTIACTSKYALLGAGFMF